ncbi:branched-chain amino acid ABC transporter permease [Chloroflexota bacterium]
MVSSAIDGIRFTAGAIPSKPTVVRTMLLETIVQGIMLGGIYSLVALGVVVVYKSTKVLNLAYGEILMILAYILYNLLESLELSTGLSLFILVVVGALMGLVLERLVMRPLVGQGFLPMIIVTLLLGISLSGIATMIWKDLPKVLPPFIPEDAISIGGIKIMEVYLWSFIVAMGIFFLAFLFFRYTSIGLDMRVTAEDHTIAQSMGINVKRIFSLSWVFSGIVAAITGALIGSIGFVDTEMPHVALAKGLPVLLLGGLESITGALIGGFIIGIAEMLAAVYMGSDVREIIPFAFMLIILIVRPHGLFGLKTIERI